MDEAVGRFAPYAESSFIGESTPVGRARAQDVPVPGVGRAGAAPLSASAAAPATGAGTEITSTPCTHVLAARLSGGVPARPLDVTRKLALWCARFWECTGTHWRRAWRRGSTGTGMFGGVTVVRFWSGAIVATASGGSRSVSIGGISPTGRPSAWTARLPLHFIRILVF